MIGLLYFFVSFVRGAAYTYKVLPFEYTVSFHEEVKYARSKISFNYFLSKGSEMDVHVLDPQGKKIEERVKSEKGDIEITAVAPGEYTIRFSKIPGIPVRIIDIDMYTKFPPERAYEEKDDKRNPELEGSIIKLRRELSLIRERMKQLKKRDERNLGSIDAIENTIGYFSMFELLLIFVIAIGQAFVLKGLFTRSGKLRI
eukprot:GHVP01041723.1.p1 GENE.GHVP01041723.1~~GHVP01041723.1.p1  ORF type:complete len:200 (+),score=32.59 GHVP01041723.1:3-602(+)